MSEVEKVRVVPSGKVYRQMFEAQALLHHQLVQPKSQNAAVIKKGLPIIHTSRETSAQGLLNSRQKNWLNGLPFDIYTENPVLYKQHADYIQAKRKKNQYPPEKSMVQALPETVASKPHSSNIVERIETSRRMRHDAALEDLSHELNIIASKLENLIEEATQTLYKQLEEDDEEIENHLSAIKTDEDILQFNYKRLESLWYQVQEHLPTRQNYMQQLDEKFTKVEEIRSVQVQQLFLKYLQMFNKIAYKSKSEIQRMMDNIAQMVNQTLLSNRMNYTNIYFQLMISDTERERKQHIYWKTRVEFWKDVNIHRFLDQFRDYLCSPEVNDPPEIEELREKMIAEHTSLNNQYKELLNALRNLYPPKCLPKLLEQWYEQTQVVSRGMYETAGIYVLELERKNDEVIKSCMEKFEETKLLLIMNQFCCTDKASTLMEEFSPMIQEIEMNFKTSMVELKMDIDKQFEHSNNLITDMYIFLQSVAKLWQTHETGLGQQEEMLHESLQEHRCWHNEQNQKREDKLDSILDEMRQGDNEGMLNSLQHQTKILLTNIQISYQEFYAEQVKIVKTYPNMVARQLEYYEENICVYFKLEKVDTSQNKTVPSGEETEKYNETVSHTDSVSSAVNDKSDGMNTPKSLDLSGDTPFSSEPQEPSKPASKSSENEDSMRITPERTTTTTTDDYHKEQIENDDNTSTSSKQLSAVESKPEEQACYLLTDSGIKYLCLASDEKEMSHEDSMLSKTSVQHLHIADDFAHEIRLQIRMNFLNHLDTWLVEAKKNSNHATIAKIEELDAEFNLRTQLHLPRAKRIEHDVYNVRAGELLLHSNRVAEHCQGVEKALVDLKMKFFSIKEQQEKMMGEFQNEIELMEPAFLNITKSGRLITLRNQMSKEIQKLMVNIRTSLRVFRVELDQALQTVRESNASLVQNFRLFSDGGNFCPEEVSQFQETIEELSKMIDENECHILVEMEGMEATRFDQASRITIEFEDRFKNHIFDLLFMETIARWLTNTQVQIKTHVAKNNTSSKDLSNFLSQLGQNIENCEQPNPDLHKFTSSEIAKMFVDSLEIINSQAKYLKCLKTNEEAVISVPCQVVLVSEIPSVCKPGKTMLDDSSVGMIKSILRSQKIPEPVEETPESSTDEDTSPTSNQENSNDTSPNIKLGKTKTKKRVHKSVSRVYKRHLIVNHSTKAVKLKLNFGEGEEKDLEEQEIEEEPSDFLGIIKQLVQNTFVSIGAIAEDFYRQKGSRPITRPQALQDTYENCAELLGDKLVSYYNQAKEYLQRCQAEFQCQLEELENLAKRIPPLLFRSLLDQHMYNLDEEFSKWENTFQDTFKHLEKQQKHHSHLLQPNVGHPQKAAQLQKLNEDETDRHTEFNIAIEKHFQELQKCSIKCSESFLQELVKCSEKLLLQFDDLLISSEVLSAKSDSLKAKQTSDFRNPETEKLKASSEKKRGIWPGVSLVELYTKTCLKSPFTKKTSPSITTGKNTLPQQSTFQSRNDVFQIYVSSFERRIASMEKRKKKLLHEEQRWFEHWKTSIENIKQLFV